MTPKPVTLKIDEERTLTLVYNNRAEFRMGSLDRPFTVQDLRVKKKAWAALVAWVWACLSEKDAQEFSSPEQVAPLLEEDKIIGEAFARFLETFNGASVPEPKNASG